MAEYHARKGTAKSYPIVFRTAVAKLMAIDMDIPKEAESNDKFIVKYRQQYYDLSRFMHKHPGGINTLKGLNSGDMTARFLKAPPHSDAAMYLMREYKIDPEDSRKPKSSQRETLHHDEDGTLRQRPRETEDKNNNQVDDSMEVSWMSGF